MHIAVDLDGTLDAAPVQFQGLLSALKAAGHTVTVLTGAVVVAGKPVPQDVISAKKSQLNQIGMSEVYNQLVVLPQNPKNAKVGKSKDGDLDLHDAKAEWLQNNHVDIFIDNNVGNAKAATKAGTKLVMVPWASKEK